MEAEDTFPTPELLLPLLVLVFLLLLLLITAVVCFATVSREERRKFSSATSVSLAFAPFVVFNDFGVVLGAADCGDDEEEEEEERDCCCCFSRISILFLFLPVSLLSSMLSSEVS